MKFIVEMFTSKRVWEMVGSNMTIEEVIQHFGNMQYAPFRLYVMAEKS